MIDIITFAIMLIWKLNNSQNNRKLCTKMQFLSVFPEIRKIACEKFWCQQNSRGVSLSTYIFVSSLVKSWLCQISLLWDKHNKFWVCMGKGWFFGFFHPSAARPILNSIKHVGQRSRRAFKISPKNFCRPEGYRVKSQWPSRKRFLSPSHQF